LIGYGYLRNNNIYYVESGTQLFDPYTDQIIYDVASHSWSEQDGIVMKDSFRRYLTEPGQNGESDSIVNQKKRMAALVPKDFKGKFFFIYHSLATASIAFDSQLVKAKGWGKISEFRAYNPMPCIDKATAQKINDGMSIENWYARNDIIPQSAEALSCIKALLLYSDRTRLAWDDRTTARVMATGVGRYDTYVSWSPEISWRSIR
jgi:hypothetical protein